MLSLPEEEKKTLLKLLVDYAFLNYLTETPQYFLLSMHLKVYLLSR